jgi:alpha-beta hydrolase superfamily lysophospholipase
VLTRTENFQHYIDDTLLFVRETLAEQEKTQAVHPRFLLCHSLGSIIGLSTYIQDKSLFDGLLVSGCAAFVDPNLATPTKVTVANWLGSLMPTFVVGKLDNGNQLSKDHEYGLFSL